MIEHMPWEHTRKAIREIHRVTKKYVRFRRLTTYSRSLLLRLPVLQLRELRIQLPFPKPLKLTAYHAWELGRPGYPVSRLRRN